MHQFCEEFAKNCKRKVDTSEIFKPTLPYSPELKINHNKFKSFETDISGDTYTLQVKLFNDMTNIRSIYIIEHLDKNEIINLESSIDE